MVEHKDELRNSKLHNELAVCRLGERSKGLTDFVNEHIEEPNGSGLVYLFFFRDTPPCALAGLTGSFLAPKTEGER